MPWRTLHRVCRLVVTPRDGAMTFKVHVKPRASRARIIGVRESALDVSVTAPPVDGAANDEVVRTLARSLGLPRRDVSIISGAHSRSKVVAVRGVAAEVIKERLT